MTATYRSVSTLLTGMLPRTSFKINVNGVNDVEEILHNRDFLVDSSRDRTFSTI